MNMKSNAMTLEEIIASALSLSINELDDSKEFNSLAGWDSMTHMILITDMESAFGVELSGDEIADMRTIGDARRILKNHGAAV